ncbi:hypothetical protein LVJ83_00295 [Uruburuella testudinis]|uniref:Uncharacterized protein n=1 Tax=Uruburuella testudinis TaxID=1282863 RepID=A0ABY4DSX0_9NEIS|nr:hypothetical protein [Uruburuella testudinis]UOO81956.1 hypothetical protein LVJ83_00295 [Uruburuella testudinis]
MKNIILTAVLSLTATAALAGAPTENYPYGYHPHGDLSNVVREVPQPHRHNAKSDDSVKFAAVNNQAQADNSYRPLRRSESR